MSSKKVENERKSIDELIDNLESRCIKAEDSLSVVSAVNDVMEILDNERDKWRQMFIDAFYLPYDERNSQEIEASNQIAALDHLEITMRLFRATHMENVNNSRNGL
jgi:hypothetical protein